MERRQLYSYVPFGAGVQWAALQTPAAIPGASLSSFQASTSSASAISCCAAFTTGRRRRTIMIVWSRYLVVRSNSFSTRINGHSSATPALFMSTFNGLYNPRHTKFAKRKDFTVNDATIQATSDMAKNSEDFMRGEVSVYFSVSVSVSVPSERYSWNPRWQNMLHCLHTAGARSWTTQSISGLNLVLAKRLQARMKSP